MPDPFSRNPKIAAILHEYDYVQEFGEGVDRMYKEMEKAELTGNELLVYRFIKANPEAPTRIIAGSIRLSTRTVQRCLSALLKKDIIENQGTKQHVKWGFPEQR